jgi:hypothetical protein
LLGPTVQWSNGKPLYRGPKTKETQNAQKTQKDAEESNSVLAVHREFRVGHAVADSSRLEEIETAFTAKTPSLEGNNKRVDLRHLRAREARLRDLRLLLEARSSGVSSKNRRRSR